MWLFGFGGKWPRFGEKCWWSSCESCFPSSSSSASCSPSSESGSRSPSSLSSSSELSSNSQWCWCGQGRRWVGGKQERRRGSAATTGATSVNWSTCCCSGCCFSNDSCDDGVGGARRDAINFWFLVWFCVWSVCGLCCQRAEGERREGVGLGRGRGIMWVRNKRQATFYGQSRPFPDASM